MNLSTLTWLLVMWTLGACGPRSKPKPLPPVVEVRYLPQPIRPCLSKPFPASPLPPKCAPLDASIQTKCSAEQMSEWDAALFDHRERLIAWAEYVWLICGPMEER